MADEISTGEIVRRLDRLEVLLLKLVSVDVYTRDQREIERRLTELERDLADRRREHADDIKDLRTQITEQTKSGGSNFRQGVYQGLLPAVLLLIGILVQVGIALRGGK